MQPLSKVAALLSIRPGEGRLAGLMLLNSFLIQLPTLFIGTASYTLFLSEFGAEGLPYVYMGNALILPLVGLLYAKLENRFSLAHLLLANIGLMLLAVAAFRWGLGLSAAKWLIFAFVIFYDIIRVLCNLEFLGLSGRLFDVRQGKRLFGLIGSAGMIAAISGGVLTPWLVSLLGIANLLFLAIAGLLATLVLLLYMTRLYANRLAAAPTDTGDPVEHASTRTASLKSRYIILLFTLLVISVLSYYFLDNAFYALTEVQYPTEEQLAGFIGVFGALSSGVTMVSQIFLTGWLVNRYGLLAGLMLLPLVDACGIAAIAITGTFLGASSGVFWIMVVTKLVDESWWVALHQPVLQILYQPLPPQQRLRVQTVSESTVQPLANGAAGLILLFLSGAVHIAYALLFILAAWLGVALLLGREYPLKVRQALVKRTLGGGSAFRPDRSSLAILEQGLTSPQAGAVLYTLDLLAEVAPEKLPTALPPLLEHHAPEVRLEALRRIERLGLTSALPAVREGVKTEGSLAVQGASLRTLAALSSAELLDEVYPYLDHPNPRLRQDAIVGLLRSGDLAGVLVAGEALTGWINSPEPALREFAAQALGEAGITTFYRPLLKLLQDENPGVQRAALAAAGKVKHPKLWPVVVKSLASARLRMAAIPALVAGGEAVLPELALLLAEPGPGVPRLSGQERRTVTRLARICGRIGGAQAIALLRRQLNFPDVAVRTHVLAALNRCGYRATAHEAVHVQQEIRAEAAEAAWTLAACLDFEANPELAAHPAISLLNAALTDHLAQNRKRLFGWLSFIYEPGLMRQVQDNLAHPSPEKRSYAVEIMDVRLTPALKTLLLPLFDELSPVQRWQRLSSHFPQPRLAATARLQEIITRRDSRLPPWTQVCALYAAAQLSLTELVEPVLAALSAPDALVSETAAWALFKLEPALFQQHSPTLSQDTHPQMVRLARQLTATPTGVSRMLTTLEKIIQLKGMELFADTSEEVLAEVAALLEELDIPAGQTFLHKGDLGSSLYIIIEGSVRVHEGERRLADLGENDFFGELALLDPAPRSADVTALSDTRLFRLNQEPFNELLEDHTEVARKMLQILARRLRRAAGHTRPGREPLADLLDRLQDKLTRSDRL